MRLKILGWHHNVNAKEGDNFIVYFLHQFHAHSIHTYFPNINISSPSPSPSPSHTLSLNIFLLHVHLPSPQGKCIRGSQGECALWVIQTHHISSSLRHSAWPPSHHMEPVKNIWKGEREGGKEREREREREETEREKKQRERHDWQDSQTSTPTQSYLRNSIRMERERKRERERKSTFPVGLFRAIQRSTGRYFSLQWVS